MKQLRNIFYIAAAAAAMASCSGLLGGEENEGRAETINSEIEYIAPATKAAWCNANEWSSKYKVPDCVSLAEAHYVYEYFKEHSADRKGEVTVDYANYFVQHVWKGTDAYATKDMNNAGHIVVGGCHMDHLYAGGEHVNNFNACFGSIMCMVDGNTKSFSYNDSYGDCGKDGASGTRRNKYIILEVPGYGTYLGFDYQTYKNDKQAHDGDGVYTDWIIKITSADGGKPTPVNPGDPDPTPDPDPEDPSGDPEPPAFMGDGSIEFDVHVQEHKDWNEIKTSIHIRDTVNCRILIPIPEEIQAPADDVVIRTGDLYEYITKTITISDKQYTIDFSVGHTEQGIEITVATASCAEALAAARAAYGDGLTFEVHTYVKPELSESEIWNYVKETKCPQTSLGLWASGAPLWESVEKDVITHTYGQITSAFRDDNVKYDYSPVKKD